MIKWYCMQTDTSVCAAGCSCVAVPLPSAAVRTGGRALEPSVKLTSGGGSREHLLTRLLDGSPSSPTIRLAEWWGKDIALSWFQLEPCGRSDYEAVKADASHHKYVCPDCGDTKTKGGEIVVEPCTFETNDSDYVDRTKPLTKEGHFLLCDELCGNVSPTPTAHKTTFAPTDDGQGHAQRCEICLYMPDDESVLPHTYNNEEGYCDTCGFHPVATDAAGDLYASVNDALRAAADGGTVTLEAYTDSKELCEEVVFDCADKSVTLEMNGYTLTNSGNPTLKVEAGTLTIADDAAISQTGSNESAAPAVMVTGGTLIFDGKLNATGASGKPAVEVTNGTLRLKEGDVLNGGVSVEDSTAYANVNALLGENLAFAKVGETSAIVKGDVTSISGDVTVVTHPHSFTLGSDGKYTCVCGYTCPHNEFENGVCKICGNGCAHTNVDGDGVCENCKTQMAAKIEVGSKTTYTTDFKAAMYNATSGTKITLLADVSIPNRTGISGDDTTVTLDLNGHKITSGWLDVGGKDTNETYTTCTLKIIGKGSYEPPMYGGIITVNMKTALDLSEWEGGTISEINISDNSNYAPATREAAVIVGPKAGTIGKLSFGNNQLPKITKTKLSGGKFNEIWAANHQPVKLGDLLASGYALQHEDGSYEKYTTTLKNSSIYNVEVVKCPHADTENGTCLYCGQTGILAMVGDTIYNDVSNAVRDWLANGGTLKLFADYGQGADGDELDLISAKAAWLAIDLNGHTFYQNCKRNIKLGGGKALTITDSSGKGTGVFGPVTADRGTLTLESGCLEKLTVPSSSTAKILLKGGRVNCISYFLPIYNLLMAGGVLMKDGVPVDPAAILDPDVTAAYTVKDSNNQLTQTGDPVTISYGQDTLPFAFALIAHDKAVAQLQFTWYRVNENGTLTALASSENTKPAGSSLYTYDTATTGTTALSGLTPGAYKAVCVVSGLDGDGSCLWMAPYANRKLTVEKADLKNAEIVFKNNNCVTFDPSVGSTVVAPDVDFTVKCNGRTLELGTDYTVSGNTADQVGGYWLTVAAASGSKYYTGGQSVFWEVTPHELSGPETSSLITKEYDGTTTLPDGIITSVFTSRVNPGTTFTLEPGTDYTVSEACYADPNVGEKPISYKITLLNKNYCFFGGVDEMRFSDDGAYAITKAPAPTADRGTLEIPNKLGKTYQIDLSQYLPALPDGCAYGDLTYSELSVDLPSRYYSFMAGLIEAKIKDGKLILPILKNGETRTGRIGEIQMWVSSTNYGDFLLYIDVNAINKTVPVGQPTLSKAELTYGEKLGSITLSGALKDPDDGSAVPGTFEWFYPEELPEPGEPWADWKFTPDDTEKYLEIDDSTQITVNKITPTGEPKYTAITTSGKTLTDANLTVDGGTFSLPGTVQWVDENGTELDVSTEVKANTAYRWRFVPEDAEHYNELTGTITLYTVSHSGGSGGSGSSGGSTGTSGKTQTVTNPDGSTTKTETKKDGTVIETTTGKDGSVSKTETKPDGSSVTENKAADGSTGTVKTDKNGQTTAETKVSAKAVEDAKANGEAVKAPVEVKAGENSSTAPTIDITLPAGAGETKVEIPVSNVSSGTVAIIVHPDGTEEIDKSGTVTETGVTVSVSGSATVKIVDNSKDFTDTRGHWSKDDVNFVAARELFNGVGNNRFGVGESMTRGMVNTVLARLAGVDTTPPSGLKWYEPGTAWAVSNGITDGTNLNGAVTREQLAAMLYRYAGSPEVSGTLSFDDAPSASGYAQDALLWAAKMGVLNGVGGNRLAPKDGASREQVAAMLARYLKNA